MVCIMSVCINSCPTCEEPLTVLIDAKHPGNKISIVARHIISECSTHNIPVIFRVDGVDEVVSCSKSGSHDNDYDNCLF